MQFVLGIFDNDEHRKLENLRTEQDAVEKKLSPLLRNGDLVFYSKYNLGMENLIHWITEFRDSINWFHFSGHHDKGMGISLTDGNFESLVTNLSLCPNLKGVFINGCSSKETVLEIGKHVPVCIGTSKPVYDGIATKFSTLFYGELNSIEKWDDYDKIHESFELAKANTNNLLTAGNIEDTTRGGGSLDDFEENLYFITEKTPTAKENFDTKINPSFEDKIEKYANNKFLKSLLSELSENGQAVTYYAEPPFLLGNIIKAFDINGEIDAYEKNRKFGKERYKLIRKLFYTYLDLCRYSILSVLWDEVNDKEVQTPYEEISKLLTSATAFDSTRIETLEALTDEILKTFGTKTELVYIKNMKPSFVLFHFGLKFYEDPLDDANKYELFWKSELLLHELLSYSKYLNMYRLRSIYSRHYLKHRNDLKPKFQVEYGTYGKKPKTLDEDDVSVEFVNIHSVYLCKKDESRDVVINLSPFYFDYNSYDPNAKRIDLFVLSNIDMEDDEIEFKFKNVYNPNIVNHQGTEYSILEDPDLNEEALKSKNLYSQLYSFINALNMTDE